MGHQGSNLGWDPNGGGGGGGSDPFQKVYAKTRRWRFQDTLTIPAGAMVIDIYNSSIEDTTIEIDGGAQEILKPGMRFNFVAQSNPADETFELAKEMDVETGNSEFNEIFVMYPSNSAVNPNTL